jgi:hypothetical protein
VPGLLYVLGITRVVNCAAAQVPASSEPGVETQYVVCVQCTCSTFLHTVTVCNTLLSLSLPHTHTHTHTLSLSLYLSSTHSLYATLSHTHSLCLTLPPALHIPPQRTAPARRPHRDRGRRLL